MVRRTVKGCVQLLGGLGAGLAIIALLIAWQIYKGPVSLSFITPYVEQALNSGHRSFRLAIADTTLNWAGWERTVELRVRGVRAIDESGEAIAQIPELSMSLSGAALLRGQLAPRYIELLGPDLRVRRKPDGALDIEMAGESDAEGGLVAKGLLGWLVKKPDSGSPMSFLKTVRVTGATITYDDQVTGKVWQSPTGHLRLARAPHGLVIEGSVLIDVDSRVADVALAGSFETDSQQLNISATFAEIAPAAFASLSDKLAMLRAIDLPLSGTVVVGTSLQGKISTVGFNITGGGGDINLPAPFVDTLPVEALSMRGLYSGITEAVTFDNVNVRFADATRLDVPAPISHAFPIKSVDMAGKYALRGGRADITKLDIDLSGPTFALTGSVAGIGTGEDVAFKAETVMRNVATNDLKTYWPASIAADPRTWITANMAEGRMIEATAVIDVVVHPDGAFTVNAADGNMTAEGVTATYLEGMPPAVDSAATITFDKSNFNVNAGSGRTGALKIVGGTIRLSGLDKVDQYADIDMRIETPIREALTLIDHKPLGFASAMGIDPKSTDGSAEVGLRLHFMLAKDLTFNGVDVTASAKLSDVIMKDVVLGRGIRDGKLALKVDKKGMAIDGNVMMGQVPVSLVWNQNFGKKAPFRARYTMAARIDKLDDVRDLGFDPRPFVGEMASGGVDATVRYTIFDDRKGRIEVNTDLARTELKLPLLSWHKAVGDGGWANVTILLENGLIKSVPDFQIGTGDLSIKGDVVYSKGGLGLERVNLKKLIFGRTNVSGAVIARPDGGWEIGLQGKELDFTPLWDRMIHNRPGQEEVDLPDLTVALEVDRMWVDKQSFLGDVSGTFVRKRDIWRTILLDSKIDGGALLSVNMTPDETGNRVLTVRADNAGDALRFFDLFDNMYGGRLEIRGRYDDAAPGQPLRGKLRVVDYRVRNAPLMTRVLSIMALTGILDALTGEGLNFTELDVPFVYREGEVQLSDAKATGTSLGFTASGTIYTQADVLNIDGTVVPAYALNSLLGRIPILGNILAGNEEGGGVFAANFSVTGPIEDPKTTVNPLSALTPGILRNLFGALKGEPAAPKLEPLKP